MTKVFVQGANGNAPLFRKEISVRALVKLLCNGLSNSISYNLAKFGLLCW